MVSRIWRTGLTVFFETGKTMAVLEKNLNATATKKYSLATFKNGKRDGFRKQTYQTERSATIRALEIIGIIPRR